MVNSFPVVEIWPKILTATSAAIIQNSGPRRILLANCGDGLAAFFPLLNPFSLGIFTFFFCATYYFSFLEAGNGRLKNKGVWLERQ